MSLRRACRDKLDMDMKLRFFFLKIVNEPCLQLSAKFVSFAVSNIISFIPINSCIRNKDGRLPARLKSLSNNRTALQVASC